jgi:glycosyltransferase involved in cell wall biosynthesis
VVDVYGSGASDAALHALAASEGATNVRFHGRVAPSEAFAVSTTAFAQLVCLQPSPLFRMTIPSKLAFAFAAGAPVLYGLEGEAAAIARDSGGAVAFDADDPASLARAVKTLLATSVTERDAMRVRLRNYYRAHFAKGELISRYVGLLGSGPAVRETQPSARERDAESAVTR